MSVMAWIVHPRIVESYCAMYIFYVIIYCRDGMYLYFDTYVELRVL